MPRQQLDCETAEVLQVKVQEPIEYMKMARNSVRAVSLQFWFLEDALGPIRQSSPRLSGPA